MFDSGHILGPGSFLPPTALQYLRRRAFEAAGVVLLLVATAQVLALISFAPSDPSLNTAVAGDVANWLGAWGAISADLLLQSIGLAALAPMLIVAAWGWRLMIKRAVDFLWLRVLALLLGSILLALCLALLPRPETWPLRAGVGGAVGDIMRDQSLLALSTLNQTLAQSLWAVLPIVGIAGILSLANLVFATGLAKAEWQTLGRALLAAYRRVAALVVASALALHRWYGATHRLARTGIAAARKRRTEPPVIPGVAEGEAPWDDSDDLNEADLPPDFPEDETDEADEADESISSRVAPPPKPLKEGAKARASRQRTLDLELSTENTFEKPPLDLLAMPPQREREQVVSPESLEQNAKLLESVLADFGVKGEVVKVRPGPVVTLYELEPAPGTKTSRVIGLADDIARSMSAISVRVAVIPGRNVIGIELPNRSRVMVYLRVLLEAEAYERTSAKLPLVLGKDIGGGPVIVDLARMPHLLIAGTTGSGKSVAINTMILSLLYHATPESCRMIMVDPKMLELSVYDGIPHLLTPVVTDPGKAVVALKWAVREMEDRYRAMAQLGVRNISGYNGRISEALKKGEVITRRVQTGFGEGGKPIIEDQPLDMSPLPYIVVIIDEMADLMLVAGKDVEAAVQRLAQMARAAGIHLIMATQRPSVDVITGTIKANFPTRISFQVTSKIDSRTILGEQGAEQLLGQGDMLYMAGGGRITRVHGPFVGDDEVESVVASLAAQGEPDYISSVTEEPADAPAILGFDGSSSGGSDGEDQLYDEAVAIIAREGKASTSFIQRHLQIGYNRAARIIERMEKEGVVSAANRVGKREVLISHHGE